MYTSSVWSGKDVQDVRRRASDGSDPDERVLEIEIVDCADDEDTGRCPRYKLHSLLLKMHQILEIVGKPELK